MAITDTRRRSPSKPESGQAMVEFALVVLFLFILFVSIFQLILMMHVYNTLADSAKEGVRFAIVHGTDLGTANCSGGGTGTVSVPSVTCTDGTGANVQNWVVNFAGVSLQNVTTTDVTVNYDPNSDNSNNAAFGKGCSEPGCAVKVTVQHVFTPFFFNWPSITIYAAADGRVMY
jgi:Flp pilus assembly protein TadG